jgi:hypothetical protein
MKYVLLFPSSFRNLHKNSALYFKEWKQKNGTHKITAHNNKTLTSKNADQYRFKERKFSKVFMKFQELPNTVEEPSYNIYHIDSNFKKQKTKKQKKTWNCSIIVDNVWY